ncbi:hypothetical protein H8E77_21585 [bacterium]|nr:hypothetical protein [bacterium]
MICEFEGDTDVNLGKVDFGKLVFVRLVVGTEDWKDDMIKTSSSSL